MEVLSSAEGRKQTDRHFPTPSNWIRNLPRAFRPTLHEPTATPVPLSRSVLQRRQCRQPRRGPGTRSPCPDCTCSGREPQPPLGQPPSVRGAPEPASEDAARPAPPPQTRRPRPLTSSKPTVLSRQSSRLMLGVFVCSSAAVRRAPCRRALPRGSSSTPTVVRMAVLYKEAPPSQSLRPARPLRLLLALVRAARGVRAAPPRRGPAWEAWDVRVELVEAALPARGSEGPAGSGTPPLPSGPHRTAGGGGAPPQDAQGCLASANQARRCAPQLMRHVQGGARSLRTLS